jgi:hypothetical protein
MEANWENADWAGRSASAPSIDDRVESLYGLTPSERRDLGRPRG